MTHKVDLRLMLGFAALHCLILASCRYYAIAQNSLPSFPIELPQLFFLGGVVFSALSVLIPMPVYRSRRVLLCVLLLVFPCLLLGAQMGGGRSLPLLVSSAVVGGVLFSFVYCMYGVELMSLDKGTMMPTFLGTVVLASFLQIVYLLFEMVSAEACALVVLFMALGSTLPLVATDKAEDLPEGILESMVFQPDRSSTNRFFARILVLFAIVTLLSRAFDAFASQSVFAAYSGYCVGAIVVFFLARETSRLTRLFYYAGVPIMGLGFAGVALATPLISSFLGVANFGVQIVTVTLWVLVIEVAQNTSRPMRFFSLFVLTMCVFTMLERATRALAIDSPQLAAGAAVVGLAAILLAVCWVLPQRVLFDFLENDRDGSDALADNPANTSMVTMHLAFARSLGLTDRESEVLSLLVRGRSLKVIEDRLCISRGTAGTHVASIYRKAQVHSQQELIDLFEEFVCG